jgi:hypothetical protein
VLRPGAAPHGSDAASVPVGRDPAEAVPGEHSPGSLADRGGLGRLDRQGTPTSRRTTAGSWRVSWVPWPAKPQRLRLDLADPLAGQVEVLAHFLEGAGAVVLETEAELEDASLAAGE